MLDIDVHEKLESTIGVDVEILGSKRL